MQFYHCLILSLLGIAYGSPYYYREDKHHSEHHKEYSYSNSQPSFSAYESSPQKYVETSHFSSHATPERYYKLETSPSFSSGFSQYSSGGGQSAFHQSGFQSSGIQSSHLSPLLNGQSMNLEGVKPGTYVIKQVKVYRQPTTYTGFYGTSHLDGRALETGQQVENLYGSQHEKNLNAQTGQYVKQVQTSLYHQVPQNLPKIIQDESFGQKQISEEDFSQFGQQQVSGQKEDCTHNEHMEDLGQQSQRGDLDIGQEQEDLSTHHSQIVKTKENTPVDDKNKGYKYYEKRVITYGLPESNAYKQTYVHHTHTHGTTDIGGKDFGKYQDILFGPSTIKTINGFENVPTEPRQESKHVRYSQQAVEVEKKVQPIKPQAYYSNPIPQPAPAGQKIYGGSLEEGQHEESLYGQHTVNLGQQQVSGSLEVGQQPDGFTGQQLETGSFELGQNEESVNGKHVHTWEKHINTSTVEVKRSRNGPLQKPIEHHLKTERLEVSSNNKPHILVKENVTRTVIVGHNIPTKPVQNLPEGQIEEPISGQNIKTGFFEVGQKEENLGQVESGFFDLGQKEETVGQLQTGLFDLGQKEENVGQLQTGFLDLGQKEENVGQLETGFFGLGQKEENVGQLETGDLGLGQHEEKLGQVETGDLGLGQHEELLEIGKKSDRKEETSYNFELGKSTFPAKLIVTPTKAPKYIEPSSYVKTYNHHESHYKEIQQNSNSKLKDLPVYYQKYDPTTPRSNEKISINTNQKTDYLKLQQKAEELALQLGLEDNSKPRSSQQESYEDKFVKENMGRTSTSKVHATEIQEHSIANHHTLEKGSLTPSKQITTWETHKEEYGSRHPITSQGSYSKKQTKHLYENQGYMNQPMLQNYGYQGHSQHSSHYGGGYRQGYSVNSGEKAYFSDQPIQRTHTSGSQFSFSSSGGSQDKQKVIDDFLKELDKDIAITNHQQRQQQGSYAGIPVNSGVSYYSQKTVSTHSNSSYSSSGAVPGGTAGKAWYQRVGDSIGSSYNQAKEKAKDIVKTVKQSVGYSNS